MNDVRRLRCSGALTPGRIVNWQWAVGGRPRASLTSFPRSRSLPVSLNARARIILSSAEGVANSSIAERLELGKATVGKWRARFIERRVAGLYDDMRSGPPRSIDDKRVASLIKTTLHTKPASGSTHRSVRSVQRYFQLFGLQPHRTEGFKLSNDPFFVEKLRQRDRTLENQGESDALYGWWPPQLVLLW